MKTPANLNIRQTIEGMTLTFNPSAAEGLQAVIQFIVSGNEPGEYYLRVENRDCSFHRGKLLNPTLTIITPSEVWKKISLSEIDGQEALFKELYKAEGDISLLMKLNSLFMLESDSNDSLDYKAPPEQRPTGPLAIKGMTWMSIAFIPWIIHWSTFDIPNLNVWISIVIPLIISTMLVIYRIRYDKPTWMEWGGLGFFVFAAVMILASPSFFSKWGSIYSSIVMGMLWFSTLLFNRMPLCGEYSKWGYIKALWKNSMFIYPNAIITLVWGWEFLLSTYFGIAAVLVRDVSVVLMVSLIVIRYLLMVPAYILTDYYQRKALELKVNNFERSIAKIKVIAGIGIFTAVIEICLLIFL
jgi:putative sterol carrier protein